MKRLILHILTFSAAIAMGITSAWLSQDTQELEFVRVNDPAQNVIADTPAMSVAADADVEEWVEFFSDESRIARPGKNKVEINCIYRGESRMAQIKFYSRSTSGGWVQKQSLEIESKYTLPPCDPIINDFNGDGFKDITYTSASAARGANELRTLFIYDQKRDELVRIRNSDEYPNLTYNPKLKCIDAWLFHGATSTVFLRLDGDQLKEFASVDTGQQLVVTVIDKDGNPRVIRREDMNEDDIYTRYSTYDPPSPNHEQTH